MSFCMTGYLCYVLFLILALDLNCPSKAHACRLEDHSNVKETFDPSAVHCLLTTVGHISKVNANAHSVSQSVTLITSRASCDAN